MRITIIRLWLQDFANSDPAPTSTLQKKKKIKISQKSYH